MLSLVPAISEKVWEMIEKVEDKASKNENKTLPLPAQAILPKNNCLCQRSFQSMIVDRQKWVKRREVGKLGI